MAVITANEPDGEIALGITLKHNATRALANATTTGYAAPTPEWAKEFEHHAKEAAAGELVADWARHAEGELSAVPRRHHICHGLANVTDRANTTAAVGNERMLRNLLRDEFATIRLGTLNHCLGDPSKALCLEGASAAVKAGGPIPSMCQPSTCRNSVITTNTSRSGSTRNPISSKNSRTRRWQASIVSASKPSSSMSVKITRAGAQMTTPVSASTESKLRDAMQRLLAGKPKRTDGRLTKANLHIEAGVSRATMNRAAAVIADWNTAVGTQSAPRDAQLVELHDTVSKLKQTIAKLRHTQHRPRTQKPSCRHRDRRTQRAARATRGDEPTGTHALAGSAEAPALVTSTTTTLLVVWGDHRAREFEEKIGRRCCQSG